MKFSNKIKHIITLFLSFSFIINPSLKAAIAINAVQRPVTLGSDIINSDRPSNLPVASYSNYFNQENVNLFENMNLSSYSGLKGFIGYGIYDKNQDQCQFLEIPNKGQNIFDQKFASYGHHNGHTYGISRNTMTYNACLSLATQFSGYPVIVDDTAENYFIDGKFATANNGSLWLGMVKNQCSDSYYTNTINRNQFFTNWKDQATESSCDSNRKNVQMLTYGKWNKVNGGSLAKCVVEWESPDLYRPVKVCAPWWRIVREYNNDSPALYSEEQLERINQTDIPVSLDICTKYDPTAAAAINKPRRDVTCTSYYSRTAAPECARDIKQKQCYVNECTGYVANVCKEKSEEITGKGYIKGQIISNGNKISVKMKDEVKTHLYSCPPSPPSLKKCLDRSSVMIWPKECPGSQCQALKECLLAATDQDSEDDCNDKYKCEKIYATRDIPPLLDAQGNVVKLYGNCSDGTQLEFIPNIIDKKNKICLEYEKYKVTEKHTQKCVTKRPYHDYHINVAFTDSDQYQNNPDCIRTDKIEDSQRNTDVTFSVGVNGYFQNRISKVNLDKTVDIIYSGGNDDIMIAAALSAPDTNTTQAALTSYTNKTCNIDLQCGDFDNESKIDNFRFRTQAVLLNTDKTKNNDINQIDFNTHKINISGLNNDSCTNTSSATYYPSVHGFSGYVTNSLFQQNSVNGDTLCTYTIQSEGLDSYLNDVKTLDGNQLIYDFKNTMTKDDCLKKAICIGGTYNENNFGSSYTSTGQCSIVSGSYPNSYEDHLKDENGCVDTPIASVPSDICEPATSTGSGFATINGMESIVVIEDFLSGPWGYYSNFTSKLPKENTVKVTTTQYSNKSLFPLINISKIKDYQTYLANIHHRSALAANPDYKAGAEAGALTAALSVASTEMAIAMGLIAGFSATGVGIIVAVVILAVVMAMNRPKRMNRQELKWTIYKQLNPDIYHSIFEHRTYVSDNNISLGGTTIYENNRNWLYVAGSNYTGRIEPGAFKQRLQANLNQKEKMLKCGGWDDTAFNLTTHASERGVIVGYPHPSPFNPWRKKHKDYNWKVNKQISKDVNTIFFGADQSLVILLPYKGDFKFQAYDKYNNLLSETTIQQDSFVNAFSDNDLKFAQVKFGPGMNLAPSVTGNTCVSDPMVEWGGGVSGVYNEDKTTGVNDNCVKSNDRYVEDHAMTKIVIQPTNMSNKKFEYKLIKPLPFANRIYAATLDKLQDRYYRCFDPFPSCTDNQFSDVKN